MTAPRPTPPIGARPPVDPDAEPSSRPGLPVWPLYLMFGLALVWWLLGGLYLLWAPLAVVLAAVLLVHGRVRLPTGSALWMLLVALIALSFLRLGGNGLVGYVLRFGFVVAAFVVYLYVYNAARNGVSWQALFHPLCLFWLTVVALGWLAVIAPKLSLTTPVEMLLPRSISAERMVQALTHLKATEHNPLSRNPYYRTAAPYPYTNNWGTGFAVMVPCVLAYITSFRRGLMRTALMVSLPLALVPAFLTLNRGMFVGVGIGLCYVGVRALLRGDVRIIASIAGVAVLAVLVTFFVPVGDLISNRVENTDSTTDRLDIYRRTLVAVAESPLLGYGAPQFVDTIKVAEPLGTQGQIWLIMYSHGIPALLALVLFFLVVARRLATAVSPGGVWLSAVPVVALGVTPFYGYTDINLSVMFFAIGLAMAAVDGPVNRPRLWSTRT
ncbi:O-antigen ligase family protein [Micromonospora inyonensis]|uniref:O-antigen ligase like membrane protein n=1 Tax=Micromonospora inyonensis TaxID=47866 RepID=A0A1C6S5V6_9ACTN|nr:O-antigen ligase family protein [Micromonospora inyonensis]SCL24645.1 O-antigen ligase like membrane protein [Micromonospora inyonensis]